MAMFARRRCCELAAAQRPLHTASARCVQTRARGTSQTVVSRGPSTPPHTPDFTTTTVLWNTEIKDVTFSEFTKGKYAVVFFYPLDFTFVCPSELIAFDNRLEILLTAILKQENTRLPGDRRLRLRQEARENGIVIPEKQYEQLVALGQRT